jgi:simple sugar transport system ATP-binding protein
MVPVVEVRSVVKSFGHVRALAGVDLKVFRGEIVALVGDNGAGKSTLVGCLAGTHRPDAGEIFLDGRRTEISSPASARAWGIETVYQDLALADELEPALNVFLGREVLKRGLLRRLGHLDRRSMRLETERSLRELGVSLGGSTRPVSFLSGGQRQAVAIARSSKWVQQMMMLDEPAAALGPRQTALVLEMVRKVSQAGVGVLLISHNLQDVFAVADRIVVLRHGRVAAEFEAEKADPDDVVAAITGASQLRARAREGSAR